MAESLLGIGVRAVIAAGWAVNDLRGQGLRGDPLLRAARRSPPGRGGLRPPGRRPSGRRGTSLTWGAYQCYGDPGFRLVARHAASRRRPPQTTGELRRRIQRLGASASDQGRSPDPTPTGTTTGLEHQLRRLRSMALEMGSVGALADLAEVHADLGEYDRAALLYRRVLRRGGREVPLGRWSRPATCSSAGPTAASAEQTVRITIHVAGDDIEVAVLVIVEPTAPTVRRESAKTHFRCDVNELVAVVPEKGVRLVAKRYEQVEIPIAVEIDPDGLTNGSGRDRETHCERGVGETFHARCDKTGGLTNLPVRSKPTSKSGSPSASASPHEAARVGRASATPAVPAASANVPLSFAGGDRAYHRSRRQIRSPSRSSRPRRSQTTPARRTDPSARARIAPPARRHQQRPRARQALSSPRPTAA